MNEKLLEEVGLTKGEIKVYSALLEIGEATTGAILKNAEISGGKVYQILDKLITKGLVSYIIKNNVKYFNAAPAERILDYYNKKEDEFAEKKEELKKEINNIKILSEHTQKNEVSLFIGFKGVESSIFRALENFHGEEILAMGVRFSKDKKFNILWEKWHHLREKRKIRCRIILSEIDKEIFRKFRNTQTRKLEGITPSAITVLGDIVLIQNYGHEVSCIYIQNEDTAESFRTFFETLWKLAKK